MATATAAEVGFARMICITQSDCGGVPLGSDDLDIAQVLFPEEDSEVESSNFSVLSSDKEDNAGRYGNIEPNDKDLE